MSFVQKKAPIQSYTDQRGRIVTLFNEGEWEEVNFLTSFAGVLRGGHYHKQTREMVYLIKGSAMFRMENVQTGEVCEGKLDRDEMLVIEPYVSHTFEALEDSMWLNFLDRPFDPEMPDMYKE